LFYQTRNTINEEIHLRCDKKKSKLSVFSRITMVSMITFGICVLFLVSTISAAAAPPMVFSAVIQNKHNTPVQCTMSWASFGEDSPIDDDDTFTIGRMESKTVKNKEIDMGAWKMSVPLKRIQCGELLVIAPFEGVKSVEYFWKFSIEQDTIRSIGPQSQDR
jgi:hypothetical protein